jgi:hypothetical protein
MADYYPLIARAVAGIEKNTDDARRTLYERARSMLRAQLLSVTPALDESDVVRERLALEEAIRKVEGESARQATLGQPEHPEPQAQEMPRAEARPRPAPERRSLLDTGLRDFRETFSRANEFSGAFGRANRSGPRALDADEAYLTLDDITEPVTLKPSFAVGPPSTTPRRSRQEAGAGRRSQTVQHDPLADLAKLIGQNDPFATLSPGGAKYIGVGPSTHHGSQLRVKFRKTEAE